MPFKEYEEFAAGPLRFPIKGKTYEVPELSWEAGLLLAQIETGEKTDVTQEDQFRLLLGPAYDDMVADKVPAQAINRAFLSCLTDYRAGRDLAEQVWEVGVDPEAFAPKGATRQTDSTSTGAENETQTPASSTGTTSPKASTRKRAKAPKAAPSTKSSPTGD